MPYDFTKFKKKAVDTEEWFKNEIFLIRTGRATPALIENVKVDYYGAKNPLKGVASIAVEDARTLLVKPWDSDSVLPVEQAIRASGLGAQAITEKGTIRVIFPDLTAERRTALLKLVSEKLEEARISMRRERDDVLKDIKEKEKEKEFSEDDKFRFKDELQKIFDECSERLEEMAEKKKDEIKN
ncbi:MAG: ribosome recycling factor [Candidatus Pacebacteria bacterium]|nr:ribosome recycling factor [Candidatus Paceibacterota bacterium]